MERNGWICLSRKLLTWQWRDDPNMVALWVHLLLRASHETTKYHGITIERGQLATTEANLSAITGLGRQRVRTCLNRLVEDQAITISKRTRVGSIISVINYEEYQENKTTNSTNDVSIGYEDDAELTNQMPTNIFPTFQPNNCNSTNQILTNSTDDISTSCEDSTEIANQLNNQILTNKTAKDQPHKQQYIIDISSSSLMHACNACAQEGGGPGGAPPGPPEEPVTPTVAADGKISPADVEAAAEAIMANAAYQPLILMRSKQTAEDAAALLPEFAAQARARGRTYATPRELAEHLANWMSKKKQFENERHNSEARRGDNGPGGGADARAEAERDRHSDALQAAYRLMARSRRGD